jgi:hypothetical protein
MKSIKLLIIFALIVSGCKPRAVTLPLPSSSSEHSTAVADSGLALVDTISTKTGLVSGPRGELDIDLESARVPFTGKILAEDPPEYRTGIEAYRADSFAVAAERLTTASRAQRLDWQIWFYLGIAEYFAGNAPAAVRALSTVEKLGPPPSHQIKARWYLANAYLLANNPQRAARVLGSVIAQNKDYKTEAAVLLAKVKALPDKAEE